MSTVFGGRTLGVLTTLIRDVPEAETWVPVTAQVLGRVQVRFVTGRGSVRTGWVPATALDIADPLNRWVEIHLAAKKLTLHTIGAPDQSWRLLAVGGGAWPTPEGVFWVELVGRFTDPTVGAWWVGGDVTGGVTGGVGWSLDGGGVIAVTVLPVPDR